MDDKTEELRDIFMSVSDDETVTERQTAQPGSLVDADEGETDERLRAVLDKMRADLSFETDLDTGTYADVVRAFYDGADDDAIAEELDLPPGTVFDARLDLHLVREDDTDAPFDLAVLRRRRDGDTETLAADLDVDAETVRHYRRIVAAEDDARAANHRYRREFDEILADADLAGDLTDAAQEDGLREAAEDIETDVSF